MDWEDYDAPSAIAVDSIGNVYVAGTNAEKYNIIKFDPNGNVLWEKSYKGPNNGGGQASKIAVDAFGNVYVTGSDQNDYATIKFDAGGNVVWVNRYNGLGNNTDKAVDLIVDKKGSVYVTGGSTGKDSDFDYTTIKYSPEGDVTWIKQYDGIPSSSDYATNMALDMAGNIYLTGYSRSTGTGDDYSTVKYSPSGQFAWESRYTGSVGKDDRPSSIAVDIDQNVYVTGKSQDSDTSSSLATIKYSSNGSLLWLQRRSSTSNFWEGTSCLALDLEGQVYIAVQVMEIMLHSNIQMVEQLSGRDNTTFLEIVTKYHH